MTAYIVGPDPSHAAWVTEHDFALAGFTPSGPETDYGMRWGERESIRVSFAPQSGPDLGYLYAHDRQIGRVQLIVADANRAEVDDAWNLLRDLPKFEHSYRAFAALINGESELTPAHARALWDRCIQGELDARRSYRAEAEPSMRRELGRAVVISERARTSAETIARDSIAHAIQGEPIVVRYRFAEWPGWFGRYAAQDVGGAADQARDFDRMAKTAGFSLQVTSASCGHRVVSAPRVPALAFVAKPSVGRSQDYPEIGL